MYTVLWSSNIVYNKIDSFQTVNHKKYRVDKDKQLSDLCINDVATEHWSVYEMQSLPTSQAERTCLVGSSSPQLGGPGDSVYFRNLAHLLSTCLNRVNKYRGVKYKSTRAFGFAEG